MKNYFIISWENIEHQSMEGASLSISRLCLQPRGELTQESPDCLGRVRNILPQSLYPRPGCLRSASEAGKMGLLSLPTSLFCRILLTLLLTVPWIKFDQQLGEIDTLKAFQQLMEGLSYTLLQEYGHS